MKNKTPWTRADKVLVGLPSLVFASIAVILWWQSPGANTIFLDDAYSDRQNRQSSLLGLEFSPDSRRLVAVYQNTQSQYQAVIFDANTRERTGELRFPSSLPGIRPAWSPDGTRIAGVYDDATTQIKTAPGKPQQYLFSYKVALWNARSGDLIWRVPYAPPAPDIFAQGITFSPDGRTLVGQGRPLATFDAQTGARLGTFDSKFDKVGWGLFNPDQTLLAFTNRRRNQLEVRDRATNRVLWKPQVSSVLPWWSDNNVLAVSDYHGANYRVLHLWDGATRRALPSPPTRNALNVALHPHQPWVAIANVKFKVSKTPVKNPRDEVVTDSELWVWNYATKKTVWRQPMTGRSSLKWSPDGKRLLATSDGRLPDSATLQFFDAQGTLKQQLGRNAVGYTIWAPNSKTLAISGDNRIELLRVE